MRKTFIPTLAGGLLLAASPDARQAPTTQIVLLAHESVRPDSAVVFASNEVMIARTCARLACPHAYVALVMADASGAPTEVWWINAFTSAEEQSRVDAAWTRPDLVAGLRPFSTRKVGLRRSITNSRLTYQRSAGPGFTLTRARFVVMSSGAETRRAKTGAVFATADSMFVALETARTRAAAERVANAMGAGARIYRLVPEWSVPATSWLTTDPTFWR